MAFQGPPQRATERLRSHAISHPISHLPSTVWLDLCGENDLVRVASKFYVYMCWVVCICFAICEKEFVARLSYLGLRNDSRLAPVP